MAIGIRWIGVLALVVTSVGCSDKDAAPAGAAAAPPLNLNLMSVEDLATLPDVTPEIAAALDADRPFLTLARASAALEKALDEDQIEAVLQVAFVPLDLNRATEDEIHLIPGMDHDMAHELEEYRPYTNMKQFRAEIGKYVSVEEVARLEQYVFLPIDLNTATRDEILALPGVGDSLAHEFEEYRPYRNMGQFRREIGKYVDTAEVARLERYVTIL